MKKKNAEAKEGKHPESIRALADQCVEALNEESRKTAKSWLKLGSIIAEFVDRLGRTMTTKSTRKDETK